MPLEDEAAEKTLGGALGGSRLRSWKRTSSERCALAGLMLGGRGGFFRLLCFRSPPPAQAMPCCVVPFTSHIRLYQGAMEAS